VLVITVTAGASCGAVWLAALVRIAAASRRPGAPVQQHAETVTREEDRVRPAVDANGERIWVEAENLFWHEIVSWPPRKAAGPEQTQGRHRRA
jgi:hypothetical protein